MNPANEQESHGLVTRFFLRHAAFLMKLYKSRGAETIWYYATMFVIIVLSVHAIFFLALVAAFLPGRLNLAALSHKEVGVAIAVVMIVTMLCVDARFKQYKFNLEVASSYGRPSDSLKLFLTGILAFLSGVGYGLLVWWESGHGVQ